MPSNEYQDNIGPHGTTLGGWQTSIATPRTGTRLPLLTGLFFLPFIFLLASHGALAVDCRISQWCLEQRCPREFVRLLRIGEMCSHGLGVLAIAVAMHQLDRARRRFVPHVLLASLGAGIAADAFKLMVARVRPRSFDFQGDVWSTFTAAFPMLGGGSSAQSFPSAHVAVAAGLTVVLSRLYPQGGWFFTALATLAACQRIQGGAHYLSDVLIGAAVGVVFARAILSTKQFSIPAAGKQTRQTISPTAVFRRTRAA